MAFFDGFFSSVGQLLPGYLEGQRQAVEDNWNDLNQYNQVQEGQLENLFNEQTMDERLQMMRDARDRAHMSTLNDAMTLELNQAYQPGRLVYGLQFSNFSPRMSELLYGTQTRQADFANQWWMDPYEAMRRMGLDGTTGAMMFPAVSGLTANSNIPSIMQ